MIGGPEDGRRLRPAPGEAVGRWAEPARSEHVLYQHSLLTDASLSRKHLVWEGAGRIALRAPARQLSRRGHTEHRLRGAQHLLAGDLLWLSRATCLQAVTTAGSADAGA